MMIAEMFYSIQGEGILAGMPSAFVCLQDGPPRPTWCQPPRSRWKPEEEVMLGALLGNVRREWYGYAVISGGEPLHEPELAIFTDGLRRIEHHSTIETSGSVFVELPCDLMSINVRLRNPAQPRKWKDFEPLPYDVEVLRQLIGSYDYQLKFEVSDRADMEEVVNLVRELGAERSKVLLLPTATKPKELKEQKAWVLEASGFFGYRYAPRLT